MPTAPAPSPRIIRSKRRVVADSACQSLPGRWLEEPDEVAYNFLRIHERASRGGHWPPEAPLADQGELSRASPASTRLRGSELSYFDNPSVMALRETAMPAPFTQGSRGCSRTSAFFDGSRKNRTIPPLHKVGFGRPVAARFLRGFPKKMGGHRPPIPCFSVYPTALIFSAVIFCQGMSMGVRPPNCSFSQAS